MFQRSLSELEAIRAGVARIGKLSDSVVRLGPLSLGLDGLLAWAPGVGELYSAAAGTYIIAQGVRAGVSLPVLAACGALMFGRTTVSALPVVGPLAADLLTAHKWSSRLVVSAIDRRIARGDFRPAGVSPPARWRWR
ncbi:MAG: DUF4112 domain-containing protein, partial [Caulobacteraceae bacterium]